MSRQIPITLTPQEIAAYEAGTLGQIVRVAVECPACGGTGYRYHHPPRGDCLRCYGTGHLPNPLGEPGDVLEFWLRDSFQQDTRSYYEQTLEPRGCESGKWVRLTRVGDARLEQLQEISEDDAVAGGIQYPPLYADEPVPSEDYARRAFSFLWDANNPDHPWASNPFVRIVGVERQGGEL